MMLSQVTNFLKKNKKIMYYLGFFAVMYFVLGNSVFAILQVPPESTDTAVAKEAISIINLIYIVASAFIGLLTQLVALFLNPGWINGNIIGIAPHLKTVWIMISNVVYFIFAILLVVIAFMNIIGRGDKWELKQALPKFVVGILIVPFTWFFVQFILSISAILTVSALTLPFDTFGSVTNSYTSKDVIPTDCTLNLGDDATQGVTGALKSGDVNAVSGAIKEVFACEDTKISIDKMLSSGDSIFSIMSVYTYGVLKLDTFDVISDGDVDWIKTIVSLGISGIINILFVLIMLILLIAIGLALFTRGVWLWLYAMFSPIFGLLYFFDKAGGGGEGAMKRFSITEFIKLALVPVYVAAALSFGLFFLFVVSTSLNEAKPEKQQTVQFSDKGTTLKMGELSYTIKGKPLGAAYEPAKSLFSEVQGGLGTLIIDLIALAILWMAVIAALKTSEITSTVVEPIAAFGKSIGDLAMKSPQYAPIFGGLSAQGLSRVGKMPQNALEQKVASNITPFQEHVNKAFGVSMIDANEVAKLRGIWNDGIQTTSELSQVQAKMRSLAETHGTESSEYRELFNEYNKALKGGQFNHLHVKDGNTFNGDNTFDDDSIKALYDGINSGAGTRAITQGYARKVLKAGGKVEIKEEGKSGFIDGDHLQILKTGADKDGNPQTHLKIDENRTLEIQQNIGGTNMAFGETGDKGQRTLMMSIGDGGVGMDFSEQSKDSFNQNNVSDILSKIEGDDLKQLQGILGKLNKENREEVFKTIFESLQAYSITEKDAQGQDVTRQVTVEEQLDEFMKSTV